MVPYIQSLTDGGVDYSFECIGKVDLMREALECTHIGWGVSVIIGVAGAGEVIQTRPFNLVCGAGLEGHSLRWSQGTDGSSEDRRLVHGWKINIDDLITHKMPLDDINKASSWLRPANRFAALWSIVNCNRGTTMALSPWPR